MGKYMPKSTESHFQNKNISKLWANPSKMKALESWGSFLIDPKSKQVSNKEKSD